MAKGSLALRAALAIALMVMFYAFAAVVVAGLIYGGIGLGSLLTEIRGRGIILVALLALACLAAALVIVWSVLPRWDRFEAPGREVTATEHPELFAEIKRIAEATGQREPAHVYLVSDVNAFVAQRGGIMGIGSSRVMGIGLPLMRTLQIDEMRAVLAHEMGHFYAGDTKLGPWIYKTRGALARTVMNLSRAGAHAAESDTVGIVFGVIRAPFHWFMVGFMRISQAISRAQEYSADAVAVRAEGQRALIDGLKKSHAAALAHALYMRNEIAPLLEEGKVPEVGVGFSRFLSSKPMSELLDKVVDHELTEGQHDAYDSHPPLRDRIAAAVEIDGPTRDADPRFAIELIRDADALEIAELEDRIHRKLERITWGDAAGVWVEVWRREVKAGRKTMRGISTVAFPITLPEIFKIAEQEVRAEILDAINDDMIRGWWQSFIGNAIAVKLIDAGFKVEVEPGSPFVFVRGDDKIDLFAEVGQRVHGEISAEDWQARCVALGIGGSNLAE